MTALERQAAATAAENRLRDALLATGVDDCHLLPLWAAVSALVKARVTLAVSATDRGVTTL